MHIAGKSLSWTCVKVAQSKSPLIFLQFTFSYFTLLDEVYNSEDIPLFQKLSIKRSIFKKMIDFVSAFEAVFISKKGYAILSESDLVSLVEKITSSTLQLSRIIPSTLIEDQFLNSNLERLLFVMQQEISFHSSSARTKAYINEFESCFLNSFDLQSRRNCISSL
jgi:hypothetical protein